MSETLTLFPLKKAYEHVVKMLQVAAAVGDDWTYEVEIVNEVYGKIVVKDEDGVYVGTL